MKCPQCAFENPEDINFCGKCGNNLERVCLDCNSVNPPQFNFCGNCGNSLTIVNESITFDIKKPQSYTPKHLADKILKSRSSIEGERKLVTVLFADVANFTSISEKLDPEEIHQIMDGCFKVLMDEIHKYEGTINQFTGDGVMALFGAPVALESHAKHASNAALSIQKAFNTYGVKILENYGVEFKLRIGINSGPVVVGSIGDDLRMDYTAIGDTTNLAARIEAESQPGSILVSGSTYKNVKDYFDFRSIGQLKIKGKGEPQDAYELIKPSEVLTRIKASQAKGLTKFVGRNDAMKSLKGQYKQVLAGAGKVVGIVGEAGVGKSRLLLEFANQLSRDETIYLEGRCLHYGGSILYMPILDILRDYFSIQEDEQEFLVKNKIKDKILALDEKLASIIPPFQDFLSLDVEDGKYNELKPKQKREKTFEALRDLFIRSSQDKPLVIVIEDIHWVDNSSEEFLDYLIGWLANTRVLLILLYRPEYTHQWGSKSYYTKIGIDQLDTGPSTALIKAILKENEIASELKKLILNKATGNPLFLEEFTYSLIENGTIQKTDRQYMLNKNVSEIHVPDTIQAIIAARMDRLDENLKHTMQIASVIGREFAFRILQTITGMREEIKSDLLNLQGHEFIYEKSLFPELEYIFKHVLIQEVAYNSLLKKRKNAIHEKIGAAIEQIYAERLPEFYERLAYHFQKSSNIEKSYHYTKMSGKKALDKNSHWEAFRNYKKALIILRDLPNTEEKKRERLKIILIMSISIHQLGFPEDSIKFVHEGEKLSKELGDEEKFAKLYSLLGVYYTYRGDQSKGIKYTEKSFYAAKKFQNVGLMTSSVQALCTAYFVAGKFQKIVDISPSYIALLEEMKAGPTFFPGGFNSYSTICGYCGVSFAFIGNFEKAEALCEKGYRLAVNLKHIPSQAWIETMCGYLYNIKGDGKIAASYSENSIKHMKEGQVSFMLGMAYTNLASAYWNLRDYESSLYYAKKGLDIQLKTGNPFYLSMNYLTTGLCHFSLKNCSEAQIYVQKAIALSEEIEEKHIEASSRIWLGRVQGKSNKFDDAIQSITDGIQICRNLDIKPDRSIGYLFLGELYLDNGQQQIAANNLKKAETMFSEMGMNYWVDRSQNLLHKL